MRISLPNQITLGRLVLAFVFFGLLSLFSINDANTHEITMRPVRVKVLPWCFWIFLIASLADWLDGYLARTLKQVTTFGRVVDPVVDKVMICGAFAFFASPHFFDYNARPMMRNVTDVEAWMVVVLIIREFLVSAIRSHAESAGENFAASMSGKLKMVIQATTVCVILGQLAWYPDDEYPLLALLRKSCVWLTVAVTGLSIITYVGRARSFLLSKAGLAGGEGAADAGGAKEG